jgi:hypothetical protein
VTLAGLKVPSSNIFQYDSYLYNSLQPHTTLPKGITLTSSGDLTVDSSVLNPISVVININLGDTILPVRIDAGPGTRLLDIATQTTPFVGNTTSHSVMRALGGEEVVGNVTNYSSSATTSSLPSNVIYRHNFTETGNDISTVKTPTTPAMGNFETGQINISSNHATVTLGGNVLDVFGTSYGIGQSLTINFTATPTSATVNFNGNTLAGFGTYYGDFQTLNLNALNTPSTSDSETIIFGPNQLYVDKAVGTVIYPGIQNLVLLGTVDSSGTLQPPGYFHQLNITFNNNIIQGNQGSDTFYGEIVNLGNLSKSNLYNGFLTGVTIGTLNGQLVTTTADGNNNSITWGNDTYVGKGGTSGTTGTIMGDTYHFTLIGDATGYADSIGKPITYAYSTAKPIMLGNITITDFNNTLDTLDFQLTPALFKSLDLNHDKQVSATELSSAVTFGPSDTGTIISFAGGSLTLDKDPNFDFSQAKFATEVNLTYAQIAPIPTNLVKITSSVLPTSLPISQPPFLYGEGPYDLNRNVVNQGPYYNELDNFFTNSLFATYSVSGTGVTPIPDPSNPNYYVLAPGLTIDKFGTINVTNTTPILTELTIIATDQHGNTATTQQLFGFLDAPITVVADGQISAVPTGSFSNIISGGVGSTLIGEPRANITFTASGNQSFGSNLIIGTTGVANAYGDFKTFTLNAQSTGGNTLTDTSASPGTTISGSNFDFKANAFDINGGNVYGVAQNFNVSAIGRSNDTLIFKTGKPTQLSLIDSSHFNGNTVTFENQTFYGHGTFYGDAQNVNVSVIAGHNGAFDLKSAPSPSSTGLIDLSGQVDHNTFTFDPISITVKGDTSGDTTLIYPNIQSLSITVEPVASLVHGTSFILDTSATFSYNQFIFEGGTITGGQGSTIFFDAPNLDSNTYFTFPGTIAPTVYNPYEYSGFINPLSVSYTTINGQQALITTTTDGFNNSITWGNYIFNPGQGTNNYDFELLEGNNSAPLSDTPLTSVPVSAIFTGFDTITHFTSGTDVITLNLEPDLYNQLVKAYHNANGSDPSSNIALLDWANIATFTNPVTNNITNTVITFKDAAGDIQGSLTLDGINVQNFTQLGSSLVVNQINTLTPTALALAASPSFDPVFISVNQPGAFAAFIDATTANPLSLIYTTTSPLPNGITLESNGILDVQVSAPMMVTITVTASNGTTTLNLPSVNIFASNSSQYTNSNSSGSSSTFSGSTAAGAYEVQAATVYGSGSTPVDLSLGPVTVGSQLIYDSSTGTTHTIYGDTQIIGDTSGATVTGQTYTFGANLLDINIGTSGSDQIYGNAQNFTVAPTGSGAFDHDTLNFGPNTIYATGNLYGNLQSLDLDATAGPASVSSNIFKFGANNLTNGAYIGGSTTPTIDSAASNLYASIGTLLLSGNESNNIFRFGNSTLTALGAANFYNDIADFSKSPFYTSVIPTKTGVTVEITDGKGDVIDFGNDTFNGTATGGNTFNFTLLNTSIGQIVGQGNTLITNFNTTNDTLTFQLTSSLYSALESSNKTMSTSSFANGVSFNPINSTTDPAYSTLSGTVINFNGAGSITLKDITGLTDFSSLKTAFSINYDDNNMAAIIPTSIPVYSSAPNTHALDQFFTQSLLATYTTTGLPSCVSIDQYGNITATNQDAFLGNIAITATSTTDSFNMSLNQGSTASQTLFIGF